MTIYLPSDVEYYTSEDISREQLDEVRNAWRARVQAAYPEATVELHQGGTLVEAEDGEDENEVESYLHRLWGEWQWPG